MNISSKILEGINQAFFMYTASGNVHKFHKRTAVEGHRRRFVPAAKTALFRDRRIFMALGGKGVGGREYSAKAVKFS